MFFCDHFVKWDSAGATTEWHLLEAAWIVFGQLRQCSVVNNSWHLQLSPHLQSISEVFIQSLVVGGGTKNTINYKIPKQNFHWNFKN